MFCWHNVCQDCLTHFTGLCIKLMVQQLASFPYVSYLLVGIIHFIWGENCSSGSAESEPPWLSRSFAVYSLCCVNDLYSLLPSCDRGWGQIPLSSQTTARLVSRQQQETNIQTGRSSPRSCLWRLLYGKYKAMWLWVILGDLSAVRTVVTVPAGTEASFLPDGFC